MPRNSSGAYTLPSSVNPVIPDTDITAAWANTTLSDLAQAVTDSLDRYGRGGMLAPFRLSDGSISAPGISFNNETSTGLARLAANTASLVVAGTEVFRALTTRIDSAVPIAVNQAPAAGNHLVNKAYADATFPTRGGVGASGTWAINITGHAAGLSNPQVGNILTVDSGTTWGSIRVSGVKGGYSGIHFNDVDMVLMVNANETGFWSPGRGRWTWVIDGNGNLIEGTIPWARVSGKPNITAWEPSSNAAGNTAAIRTPEGYLRAVYFNQSSPSAENPGVANFFVENGDGFLRKANIGHIQNTLGLSAYALKNSSPTFSGLIRGNNGGSGLGAIHISYGPPSFGGSYGDLWFELEV